LWLRVNIFWSVVKGMVGISLFGKFQNNAEGPALRHAIVKFSRRRRQCWSSIQNLSQFQLNGELARICCKNAFLGEHPSTLG
jgi:hypothetical protein